MKKEFWVPVAVFGLALAFVAVSALVVLSRGRSRFWIERKLRLGAMLLTLSGVVTTGCPTVTCYDQVSSNYISLDKHSGIIELNAGKTNQLTGMIQAREGDTFAFAVLDVDENHQQIEDIAAADGAFDENNEEFEIAIDTSLAAGDYTLRFYDLAAADVSGSTNHILAEYQLKLLAE